MRLVEHLAVFGLGLGRTNVLSLLDSVRLLSRRLGHILVFNLMLLYDSFISPLTQAIPQEAVLIVREQGLTLFLVLHERLKITSIAVIGSAELEYGRKT